MKRVIPTEIYSRVVGYYRPVSQWNKGKQAEFEQRKEFDAKGEWKNEQKINRTLVFLHAR